MVGMMGAGKTAVGKAVAQTINVAFRDCDDEIEAAAALEIAEIFERFGEDFFREKEQLVLERLLQMPPFILSSGGGAFVRWQNRALIANSGAISVWLRADLETLWARVKSKSTRPLLNLPNPKERLAELLDARNGDYGKADIVVESDGVSSVDRMALHVIEALTEQGILKGIIA